MRTVIAIILSLMLSGGVAAAQELSAIARLDAKASSLRDSGRGIALDLAISQPVPWRVRLLADPPRLILDTREVDFASVADIRGKSGRVIAQRAGVFRPGWSRLVLEMDGPYAIASAEMTTGDGPAQIALRLEPTDAASFAALAARPEPAGWALPRPADLPRLSAPLDGPLVVVLDPGHGGLDPGAENGDQREAHLVLTFARELKNALQRDGDFLVILTRDDDVFVPLEARISVARAAGATVLMSLHADALAEGEASGATIYTLSDDANDLAARALAERHDRDDLLAGVDLTDQDDLIASVLMDMARTETAPKVDSLAEALKTAIKAEGLRMHRHPIQSGGFSVLKSPDIPSVLVELGFLSSPRDLARLTDPEWRARMIGALRAGLIQWAQAERIRASAGKP